MARQIVHVGIGPGRAAIAVRLPVGQRSVTPKLRSALEDMQGRQRLSNSNACTVAFFKGKGGKLVAAQRCDNRKLKGHNKKQCRAKAPRGSRNYKRFVRCR